MLRSFSQILLSLKTSLLNQFINPIKMLNTGPIVFVEDDEDDMEIYKIVLSQLGVESVTEWFKNSDEAFEYLINIDVQPYIIICDLNLPGRDGIELKLQIDANKTLRKKSIPFVFLSTAVDKYVVEKAYTEMTVQGFFKKSSDLDELKNLFAAIFNYWMYCKHPNSL